MKDLFGEEIPQKQAHRSQKAKPKTREVQKRKTIDTSKIGLAAGNFGDYIASISPKNKTKKDDKA